MSEPSDYAATPATQRILPEVLEMSESQLNLRIEAAKDEQRLKRKRQYLDALMKGEETNINPLEFEEPALPKTVTEPPA